VDPVRNPYTPGAGSRPQALVGRDGLIEEMDVTLRRILLGRHSQSQLLTGLRGVGKTVLLNEFEELADGRGYFHEYIEVSEDGSLAPALAAALRRVLLEMDAKRRLGDALRRAFGVLKGFALRLPDGSELHIDVDAVLGPADSGDLEADLAGLFVELGKVAREHRTGMMLTVDELHYVDRPTLTALIVGIHRASQLNLPIMVAGAGLPNLAALTGDAKTYAERLLVFPVVDSLTPNQAEEALRAPALDEDVTWEDGAIAMALEVTQCYPYFLQEFGKRAWQVSDGPDTITADDFERAIPVAMAALDDSFFRVRAAASSPTQRIYMRAIARLGPGPVRTKDIADLLHRDPSALSPTRDTLIKRALCYVPERGQIDFTVPLFGDFMKRWMPGETG
jgi:AAA ATPase domain